MTEEEIKTFTIFFLVGLLVIWNAILVMLIYDLQKHVAALEEKETKPSIKEMNERMMDL